MTDAWWGSGIANGVILHDAPWVFVHNLAAQTCPSPLGKAVSAYAGSTARVVNDSSMFEPLMRREMCGADWQVLRLSKRSRK